jgi:hypothetical protein
VVELVVDRPGFFTTIPTELAATAALQTVRLKDRVRAPLTSAGTASYEWQIGRALFTSVGYMYSRGNRLLRSRNVNAPDPITGLRPYQDRGPMLQFESTGRSVSHEFRATARRVLTRVSFFGTYLWRSALSDTDGPYTVAADAQSLQGEYGRAGDDERHRLTFGTSIALPGEWSISSLLTIGSGRPFNITTGLDGDGDYLFTDRPALVAADAPGAIATAFGSFDVHPARGERLVGRNAGQGPGHLGLNVGVAKVMRPWSLDASGPSVMFIASAENITNRVNFSDFNGVVTSPLFGRPNRALNPRRVELAARFAF